MSTIHCSTTLRSALTLALLGTALAGQAQSASNADIYGSIGAGVDYITNQTGGGAVTKLSTNPLLQSYMGFRGREDMGGGLSAVFKLESNIDPSVGSLGATVNGTATPFNRAAFVGLKSDTLGTLTLGRQYLSMVDLVIEQLDAFNVAGPNAFTVPLGLTGTNRYAGYDAEASNSVKYRYGAPKGLQASLSYGFGGVAGSSSQGSDYSFALQQKDENYNLGAGYVRYNAPTLIASNGSDPTETAWTLGGNMTFGNVKPYFAYYNTSSHTLNASLGTIVDKIYTVGVAWNVAPFTLRAAFYADKGTTLNGVSGRNGNKNTLVLGAEYWLSKRANVFFAYSNNALSGGYMQEPVFTAALNRNPSASSVQLYSVGINERF